MGHNRKMRSRRNCCGARTQQGHTQTFSNRAHTRAPTCADALAVHVVMYQQVTRQCKCHGCLNTAAPHLLSLRTTEAASRLVSCPGALRAPRIFQHRPRTNRFEWGDQQVSSFGATIRQTGKSCINLDTSRSTQFGCFSFRVMRASSKSLSQGSCCDIRCRLRQELAFPDAYQDPCGRHLLQVA